MGPGSDRGGLCLLLVLTSVQLQNMQTGPARGRSSTPPSPSSHVFPRRSVTTSCRLHGQALPEIPLRCSGFLSPYKSDLPHSIRGWRCGWPLWVWGGDADGLCPGWVTAVAWPPGHRPLLPVFQTPVFHIRLDVGTAVKPWDGTKSILGETCGTAAFYLRVAPVPPSVGLRGTPESPDRSSGATCHFWGRFSRL